MAIKPPSGAEQPDLEKILAQLLSGATAEEVLETVPAPVASEKMTPPEAASTSAGSDNPWGRFSATGGSKEPVSSSTNPGNSAMHARIALLLKK